LQREYLREKGIRKSLIVLYIFRFNLTPKIGPVCRHSMLHQFYCLSKIIANCASSETIQLADRNMNK
jgi:hypothetical protein